MRLEPIDPTTQEPLDDEERELMDPDAWNWDNPIEGRTVGIPGAILEIRLTRDEFVALSRFARSQGITTHELMKQAALDRLPQHAAR